MNAKRTFMVWEVKDGFSACYCETLEDAHMVANEYNRRNGVIGETGNVTIEECEVWGIDEGSRHFVENLRKHQNT